MIIYDWNKIKALPLSKAREGCFVINMPNDVYQKFAGISNSGLSKIAESPAAYASKEPWANTSSKILGSAVHAAILEPELFKSEYHLIPEIAARTAPEYKALKKIHGAEFVMVKSDCHAIDCILNEAKKDREVMGLMNKNGVSEVSAFVACPDTGVLLRCRYDYLIFDEHLSVDLKTTNDASAEGFSKSIDNFRYHVQEAMYCHIYKLLTGNELAFKFVALQTKAPFTVRIYTIDEYAKLIGEHYFKKDLAVYVDCHNRNFWPHPDCNGEIGLPYWSTSEYEREIDEKMMDEFEGDE